MTMSTFYIPAVNMMGEGSLDTALATLPGYGLRRALVVTDAGLERAGVAARVALLLRDSGIEAEIYAGVQPNPTVGNVEAGVARLHATGCDFIVSLGGGSSHDCSKGIALVATNGGGIADYEGVDKSAKPQLPLVAINTTAGTASEMTRFCIITNERTHIKMAIVDRHVTPLLSVNDPTLMLAKPKALTAATGMDALTHAVEAYVSTAANPITDACAIKAVSMIFEHLPRAVSNGQDLAARNAMAYAQFLAGMAFNNASLGYVHAMAHQLGGFYDLPHGVCNAVLLPHVEAFNATAATQRLADLATAMGASVSAATVAENAQHCIAAIRRLSMAVGIPAGLRELGVKPEDIPTLAANALKDACGLTNPRRADQTDLEGIFRAAL